MSNVAPILTPLARFQAYKEAQGFTSEQINAHNIQCVCDSAVLRVPAYVLPCVPFFYYNPDGALGDRFRVRLLNPTPGKGKYWQPANSGDPGPYLPQGQWDWTAVFADASVPLVIPEGEAKSIIAQDYLKPLGIAVMAIGGVAMWRELLRREDIVWRGRKVIIAFDHDDGQEPGQYGPGVALQLSRFAEALAERGAVVSCTQLGIIARDQGMVGKVGLDDYFRKGGTADELVTRLAPAPVGCELLADMFSRYVVVTLPTPVVWDRNGGRSYKFHSFHEITCNRLRLEPTAKGSREVRVSDVFLKRHDRPEAYDFVLDPRLDYGYLESERVINSWRPFRESDPALVKPEYVSAFGRLVEVLAGEFPTQIGQWLAHYVRKPWERTSQAVLISTPHMGIGKSLLGELIGHLVGSDHYAEVDHDSLKGQFNDYLEGKSWLLWNELDLRFSASESWLRNLLSQEKVRVEVKGGAVYEVANLRRYMMNSNMEVALRIAQGNRRVWVCYPTLTDDDLPEWKAWLWREIVTPWREDRDSFMSSVRAWLDSVDLEGYDPMQEVVNGEAAAELMEESMTATQSAMNYLWQSWEDSGDEVLVINPILKKKYAEVFKHLKARVKAKGWGSGTKVIKSHDGKAVRLVVVGRGKAVTDFSLDEGRNSIYVGNLDAEYLRSLDTKHSSLIIEACDHLKS